MKLSLALGPGLLGSLASGSAVDQHPIGDWRSSAGSIALSSSPPASADGPSYRNALLDLHKSLVNISSISGTENEAGSFLVEYLTARGYVAQLQFLPPADNTPHGAERFNVLAWPGPTRNPKPRVLISSHIDVVPPFIPYHIDADGGRVGPDTLIRGRGSVDAKASVAAQITALEELLAAEEVAREDAMLLFVVGEETTGDGMKFFSSSLDELDPPPRFEAVIFGEPTENKLACGHKGIGLFDIRAQGKAAHSGYPWLGKSATELLMRALLKIVDTDLGSSKRFGNTTVNVGVVDGGVARNVVPKTAGAALAVRIGVGNQSTGLAIVVDKVEQILKEVDEEAFTFHVLGGYGPVEANCDVEGFDKIAVNYGTDVPNLEGDHTRYLYGPGSILVAHGDDEAITVADLETSVEGYKKLIKFALQA